MKNKSTTTYPTLYCSWSWSTGDENVTFLLLTADRSPSSALLGKWLFSCIRRSRRLRTHGVEAIDEECFHPTFAFANSDNCAGMEKENICPPSRKRVCKFRGAKQRDLKSNWIVAHSSSSTRYCIRQDKLAYTGIPQQCAWARRHQRPSFCRRRSHCNRSLSAWESKSTTVQPWQKHRDETPWSTSWFQTFLTLQCPTSSRVRHHRESPMHDMTKIMTRNRLSQASVCRSFLCAYHTHLSADPLALPRANFSYLEAAGNVNVTLPRRHMAKLQNVKGCHWETVCVRMLCQNLDGRPHCCKPRNNKPRYTRTNVYSPWT